MAGSVNTQNPSTKPSAANDPAIAAIANYERVRDADDAAFKASDAAHKAFKAARSEATRSARYEEYLAASKKTESGSALYKAQDEMFATAPTSRAGAIALLKHVADFFELDYVEINVSEVDDVIADAIRAAVAVLERDA